MPSKRDLAEIFGYAPNDLTNTARSLWDIGACPFINKECIKTNHDQSIIYGTCSVTSPYGDIIICPNRLYENNYNSIRKVSHDAFGEDIEFLLFEEYIKNRMSLDDCVVALGQNSGKEIKLRRSLSMDWILARVKERKLEEYVGIEVQSIDITGNYRDAWHGYKNLGSEDDVSENPSSRHGLNWANVHKRLIPQIIRKGVIYSKSELVKHGIYFVVPEIVYRKFEEIIGSIPTLDQTQGDSVTVHTYELGEKVKPGEIRPLDRVRTVRFLLKDFSDRFISGPNLPAGVELDNAVKKVLGLS